MSAECYPISVLPHTSRLYGDYLAMGHTGASPVRAWYGASAIGQEWMGRAAGGTERNSLADELKRQGENYGAGAAGLENIERLRHGARAVVTGQQVGLFGGPLLTLLKAATAVAKAREATRATGVEHVPVFWCATEDHDLAEVDQVTLLAKEAVQTLRLGLRGENCEVGGVRLGSEVGAALDRACELLGDAPVCDLLRQCYVPGKTLGGAFVRWMTQLFAGHGLIVMDAAGREFHRLGAQVLRAAIERAEELEAALLDRSRELQAAGYHAQVLVNAGASLLFLIEESGARVGLRRSTDGGWKAGARNYTTEQLLNMLSEAPERLSPNALLRPVFQDCMLPTAAYIGGPAEIAYFAQSAVLYQRILGHLTPVLPRFSATLIEPKIAEVMRREDVTLEDVFTARTVEPLAQRLGARTMPIAAKRRLAAAGNAMDQELGALTEYLGAMDESLGRSASVSANKMRYQMNRLRRIAANFELQKESSLGRHAAAMMLHLFPTEHPQERVLAGAWFLGQYGEGLIDRLVSEAAEMCVGHAVVRL